MKSANCPASSAFSPPQPTNIRFVLCVPWTHWAAAACLNMTCNAWVGRMLFWTTALRGSCRFVWCQQGCKVWWLQVWMREWNKSHTRVINWLLSPGHCSCAIKQLYCCRIEQITRGPCLNTLELQRRFVITLICTSYLDMHMTSLYFMSVALPRDTYVSCFHDIEPITLH